MSTVLGYIGSHTAAFAVADRCRVPCRIAPRIVEIITSYANPTTARVTVFVSGFTIFLASATTLLIVPSINSSAAHFVSIVSG